MQMEALIEKLNIVANEWEKWALEQVPEDYTKRGLSYKYLRGDNIAAGYYECADDLREALQDTASNRTPHEADAARDTFCWHCQREDQEVMCKDCFDEHEPSTP